MVKPTKTLAENQAAQQELEVGQTVTWEQDGEETGSGVIVSLWGREYVIVRSSSAGGRLQQVECAAILK